MNHREMTAGKKKNKFLSIFKKTPGNKNFPSVKKE